MDFKKLIFYTTLTIIGSTSVGILLGCGSNNSQAEKSQKPKIEDVKPVQKESELEKAIKKAVESDRNREFYQAITDWHNLATIAESKQDYSNSVRALYNIGRNHLKIKEPDYNSIIEVSEKALDVIKQHRGKISQERLKLEDDLYLRLGKAYAQTDRSVETGVKMFENYFHALLIGQPGIKNSDLIDLVQGIPQNEIYHKNASRKYQEALKLFTLKEQDFITSEIKKYAKWLIKNETLRSEGERALRVYGLK